MSAATLQEELRQALIDFRPWVTYRAEDGYPAVRQLDGEDLADTILPIVERIVTKQVGLHELGKCVPVEDANRVLAEARELRQAVIRERVVVTAWWAHHGADIPDAWWDAACKVDHLIDELEARWTR